MFAWDGFDDLVVVVLEISDVLIGDAVLDVVVMVLEVELLPLKLQIDPAFLLKDVGAFLLLRVGL